MEYEMRLDWAGYERAPLTFYGHSNESSESISKYVSCSQHPTLAVRALHTHAPHTNTLYVRMKRCFRYDLQLSWVKILQSSIIYKGPCGKVVGWGTMLQAGRSRVRFLMTLLDFSNLPNPGVDSASKQEWVPGIFFGVKGGQCVRLITLLPSVSRLSREDVGASTSHNPMGLHGLLQGHL
jgi:hypothetical protein